MTYPACFAAALSAAFLFAGTASGGLIASTSFENEAPASNYANTLTDGRTLSTGTVVDIANAGPEVIVEATVDSTSSSATAGDVGFDAFWVNTQDDRGLSESDPVGVTSSTAEVGAFTDGTQGYAMSDTDGLYRLTFDSVNVAAYANVEVSIDYFLQSTSYQPDDLLRIFAETEADRYTLFDTTGQDIDDFEIDGVRVFIEDSFRTASVALPDSASTVRLVAEFDSDGRDESVWLDNYQVTGDLAPEAVPEPATTLLLGLAGVGGLATRRLRRRRPRR